MRRSLLCSSCLVLAFFSFSDVFERRSVSEAATFPERLEGETLREYLKRREKERKTEFASGQKSSGSSQTALGRGSAPIAEVTSSFRRRPTSFSSTSSTSTLVVNDGAAAGTFGRSRTAGVRPSVPRTFTRSRFQPQQQAARTDAAAVAGGGGGGSGNNDAPASSDVVSAGGATADPAVNVGSSVADRQKNRQKFSTRLSGFLRHKEERRRLDSAELTAGEFLSSRKRPSLSGVRFPSRSRFADAVKVESASTTTSSPASASTTTSPTPTEATESSDTSPSATTERKFGDIAPTSAEKATPTLEHATAAPLTTPSKHEEDRGGESDVGSADDAGKAASDAAKDDNVGTRTAGKGEHHAGTVKDGAADESAAVAAAMPADTLHFFPLEVEVPDVPESVTRQPPTTTTTAAVGTDADPVDEVENDIVKVREAPRTPTPTPTPTTAEVGRGNDAEPATEGPYPRRTSEGVATATATVTAPKELFFLRTTTETPELPSSGASGSAAPDGVEGTTEAFFVKLDEDPQSSTKPTAEKSSDVLFSPADATSIPQISRRLDAEEAVEFVDIANDHDDEEQQLRGGRSLAAAFAALTSPPAAEGGRRHSRRFTSALVDDNPYLPKLIYLGDTSRLAKHNAVLGDQQQQTGINEDYNDFEAPEDGSARQNPDSRRPQDSGTSKSPHLIDPLLLGIPSRIDRSRDEMESLRPVFPGVAAATNRHPAVTADAKTAGSEDKDGHLASSSAPSVEPGNPNGEPDNSTGHQVFTVFATPASFLAPSATDSSRHRATAADSRKDKRHSSDDESLPDALKKLANVRVASSSGADFDSSKIRVRSPPFAATLAEEALLAELSSKSNNQRVGTTDPDSKTSSSNKSSKSPKDDDEAKDSSNLQPTVHVSSRSYSKVVVQQ